MDPLWRNPSLEVEREREWDGFACIVSKGPTDRTRPRRRAASGREEGRGKVGVDKRSFPLPSSERSDWQAGGQAGEGGTAR